ncbi:hypothetical protein ACHAWF_003716 [Thalassiosira exigua]
MGTTSLSFLLVNFGLAVTSSAAADAKTESNPAGDGVTKAQGPPPFFLQDSADSLCLAGEDFCRCSGDALFFVVGSPGSYQIHKRPGDDVDALGSAAVPRLSQGHAEGAAGSFATVVDIEAMSSPGARFIGAVSDGDKKLVEKLLKEEKIDANHKDWDDLTPLIPAASAGHLDEVKLLLKEGADIINAKDKNGIMALIKASIMGHVKIVELLIKEGAEVDTPANSGVTALWLAS